MSSDLGKTMYRFLKVEMMVRKGERLQLEKCLQRTIFSLNALWNFDCFKSAKTLGSTMK
jgi:hypothetical protein